MDLKQLESILKLMDKYQVDCIEQDGIKISKSKHPHKTVRSHYAKKAKPEYQLPVNFQPDDEIMFAQSSAPALDFSTFNTLGIHQEDETN
jgi:hypothetical protein